MTPRVAAAAFARDGALEWEEASLATMPEMQPCSCNVRGAAFGEGTRAAAAVVEGDTLWLARLDLSARTASAPIALARLTDAPPRSTPLAGTTLSDGRLAIAVGGHAPGLEPRDAALVIEQPTGAPTIERIPGERFDPPPSITARDGSVFVFRFVSSADDLGASGLIAERRDGMGRVEQRASIAVPGGYAPSAMAAYRGAVGAGLVWARESGELHVMPSQTDWSVCEGEIIAPPIATMDDRVLSVGSSREARRCSRWVLVMARPRISSRSWWPATTTPRRSTWCTSRRVSSRSSDPRRTGSAHVRR